MLWAVHERRSIAEVIHTGQRGCAQMTNRWAFEHDIKRTELRAEYGRYGERRAPMICNRKILELRPNGVFVFSMSADVRDLLEQTLHTGVGVMPAAEYYRKLEAPRNQVPASLAALATNRPCSGGYGARSHAHHGRENIRW